MQEVNYGSKEHIFPRLFFGHLGASWGKQIMCTLCRRLVHISNFWKVNQLATHFHPKKIQIGFVKQIKILAVREVRPNCTRSFIEKYKGLKKLIKEKKFRHVFSFFYIPKIVSSKMNHMALILKFRTPISTKFIYVIFPCHMRHLSYYDILCHMMHMTYLYLMDLGV